METWAVVVEKSGIETDYEMEFIGVFSTLDQAKEYVNKKTGGKGKWCADMDMHTYGYSETVECRVGKTAQKYTTVQSVEYDIYRAPLDSPISYS